MFLIFQLLCVIKYYILVKKSINNHFKQLYPERTVIFPKHYGVSSVFSLRIEERKCKICFRGVFSPPFLCMLTLLDSAITVATHFIPKMVPTNYSVFYLQSKYISYANCSNQILSECVCIINQLSKLIYVLLFGRRKM